MAAAADRRRRLASALDENVDYARLWLDADRQGDEGTLGRAEELLRRALARHGVWIDGWRRETVRLHVSNAVVRFHAGTPISGGGGGYKKA